MLHIARFGKVWQHKKNGKIYGRELDLSDTGDNIGNYRMIKAENLTETKETKETKEVSKTPDKKVDTTSRVPKEAPFIMKKGVFNNEQN